MNEQKKNPYINIFNAILLSEQMTLNSSELSTSYELSTYEKMYYERRTHPRGTPLSPRGQLITSVRTILPLYVPSSGINPNHFIFIIIHQSSIRMNITANTYRTCTYRIFLYSNENQNKEQASEKVSSKQQEASSKDGSFNQSKVIEYIALLQGQSEGE